MTYDYFHPYPSPCPSCGHCPTCGRGGWKHQPHWSDHTTTTTSPEIDQEKWKQLQDYLNKGSK